MSAFEWIGLFLAPDNVINEFSVVGGDPWRLWNATIIGLKNVKDPYHITWDRQ